MPLSGLDSSRLGGKRFRLQITKGDFLKLQQTITMCSRYSFFLTLPLGLVLILFSSYFFTFIYGKNFVQSAMPLNFLILGQIVNSYVGSVALILNMTKNEKVATKIFALSTFLCIILNLVLIPLWGANGAAIAASTSLIAWNVLMSKWINQNIGIRTLAFL